MFKFNRLNTMFMDTVDDIGGGSADVQNQDNVDVQNQDDNTNTDNEPKTFTQEEVNKIIEKRLAKAQKNYKLTDEQRQSIIDAYIKEQEKIKAEQERKKTFEEMSADEKVKELMRQIEEQKTESAKKERQNKLMHELTKEGIDEKYISLLNLTDDETAFKSFNNIKELVSNIKASYDTKLEEMVEERVKERLKGNIKVTNSSGNQLQSYKEMSQAEFVKAIEGLSQEEIMNALKERNKR